MKLGIVGLPNVGKSTLFNAITEAANAESANYPFCTIDPNVGTVAVPDRRLDFLTEMYSPKKTTPAVVEFVDIAGLVKGAHAGEGLGNQFLSHIRQTAAIIHVVRCFDDENIIHVEGKPDPIRDIGIIELELIMSDMEAVQRRIDKGQKVAKSGDKQAKWEVDVFTALLAHLDEGQPVRSFAPALDSDLALVQAGDFLSAKPVIYAANMDESSFTGTAGVNAYYDQVVAHAAAEGAEVLPISAKVEQEIVQLPPEERAVFLEELGLERSGLDRLIQCSYSLLGLISFLTAGPEEVRAWTITRGTRAPQAAGKIHTDFERGFIRAEVVAFDDLRECGDMAAAKAKGLVRSEGKEYTMQDGDVVLFRFNV
ncbi:MAG: redox-regulated ATPase YchF [Oscillospiraceae bacterium]|nr:redox-regulated ATPase YchF [Oscillospiraceae bacterium]